MKMRELTFELFRVVIRPKHKYYATCFFAFATKEGGRFWTLLGLQIGRMWVAQPFLRRAHYQVTIEIFNHQMKFGKVDECGIKKK